MKVSVSSKMRLSPLGWVGAVLFVGSPLFGAWVYMQAIESAARSLRYGGSAGDPSSAIWTAIIASALSLAGLVMVLVGRHYEHRVETTQ